MKPLSVVQVLSGGLGGAENMAVTLAKALQAMGVQSSLLCLQDGPFVEYARRAGVRVDVVPMGSTYAVPAIHRLYSHFRRARVDVVHTHLWRAMFMGNVAARLARVPLVVTTFHSIPYINGTSVLRRAHARVQGAVGRLCTDVCVAYAEKARASSIRDFGLSPDRVVTIHNGVNLDAYRPLDNTRQRAESRRRLGMGPGDFVIGAVGRLVAVKGHIHLVAAMPHVAREVPEARLIIVGAGPSSHDLNRAASSLGAPDRIAFAGDVRADSALYGAMDVFVYPSIKGVFGIVVLEAMACGVPVVVSGLRGTEELVRHEQNGLLVPPGDDRAIAAAVLRLYRDATLRRRLVAAGLDTVARGFTDAEMARRYRSLYDSLLAAPEP